MPQWSLATGNNALGYFEMGQKMGADLRGRQKEEAQRNALAAYAQNPNDPKAVAGVIAVDPATGIKLQQYQTEALKTQRQEDVQRRAAAGDPAAMAELSGIDFNAWSKLSDTQKAQAKAQTDYIGQAAVDIARRPADQRAAAWDAYIQNGVQRGFSGLAGYQGKYSEDALRSAVASAGQMKQFFDATDPHYMSVPKDADLVNTHDPEALAVFQRQRGNVLRQQSAPPPNPAFDPAPVLKSATARGYILPDEYTALSSHLNGPNGRAAMDGWLTQNKVKRVTRTGTAPDGRKVVQFEDGTVAYAQ